MLFDRFGGLYFVFFRCLCLFLHPIILQCNMEQRYTINLSGGVVRNADVRFALPVDFSLCKGEHIAVVGRNGSGKSVLAGILTGRYPLREGVIEYDFSPAKSNTVYENIRYISFRDVYGSAETGYYYQQRWNVHEQDDDIPTVGDLLTGCNDKQFKNEVLEMFGVASMLEEKIILLSSGELRKFQVANALLSSPRLLIMDNPFIGLDEEARRVLNATLEGIASLGHVQTVLLVSSVEEIPSYVTHVVEVASGVVGTKLPYAEFMARYNKECADVGDIVSCMQMLPDAECAFDGEEVLSFRNVTVQYADRVILKNVDWTVSKGESWLLTGCNGSGKSTLLSLVSADNLQSYACDISLFGRRRGSGESIWEIKKHIGYVSPEMHRGYLRNLPMGDIVASGLHDSIGLYVKSTPEQLAACEFWMKLFGIEHLKERSFITLSDGEQRLALLARAFVKDPSLLILDEPLHGLDSYNKQRVNAIIEAFSRRHGKTIIYVSHYENEVPATVTKRLHLKKEGYRR